MSSGCDYTLEDNVYILFTTRAFATGIPGTLSTSTVSIYEDVTATPVLDDVAVTESLNSVAGLNAVTIAATAANGFNVGGAYHVVIKTGTVDSVSVVGEVVGNFTIGHSAAAVDLANGTDGLGAIKTDTAAILDDTGTTGVLLAAGAVTDASLAGNMEIVFETDFATNYNVTRNGWVTNAQDFIGTTASDPFNGQVVAASVTGAVGSVTGAVGSVTGSVGSNVELGPTEVNSEVASALATFWTSPGTLVDLVWDEVNTSGAHNVNNSTGKQLREGTGALVVTSGTCQAAGQTTTNVRLAAGESSTDNIYNHKRLVIVAGTNVGFDAVISDYDGTNKDCTITPALPAGCDNTSEYEITPAIVHAETQGGGYADGAIWVAPTGSTGTQLYVDGTVDNPIADSSWANVLTVAVALNLERVHILPGSSVTFGAAVDNYTIMGNGYSIALGGQSVNGTIIEGATVTGNDDGANTSATVYRDCLMGTSTLGLHRLDRCGLSGTITLAEAGTYDWVQCHSRVAGTGSPSLTFGAGNMNVNMRRYSGGIQVESMGASASTDTMSLEGNGQFIEGTCTGGTVAIRGCFTVSGITNLTLSDDARMTRSELTDDVWDELLAGHTTSDSTGELLNDWQDGGRLDLIIDQILADTADIQPNYATSTALANAQTDLDTLTDTSAEPTGVPAASATLLTKVGYLYMALRNQVDVTATKKTFYDDGGTGEWEKDLSDDGTTYSESEGNAI